MRDHLSELQLETVETIPTHSAQHLVNGYAAEIRERRDQLLDDLAIYESKLRDTDHLDPLDFTGLGKLYRGHVIQIRNLLEEFDDAVQSSLHEAHASSITP